MNKHIVKRSQGLDSPIVWCGRSIPGNSITVSIARAVAGDDNAICKNCVKTVIRKLENKITEVTV